MLKMTRVSPLITGRIRCCFFRTSCPAVPRNTFRHVSYKLWAFAKEKFYPDRCSLGWISWTSCEAYDLIRFLSLALRQLWQTKWSEDSLRRLRILQPLEKRGIAKIYLTLRVIDSRFSRIFDFWSWTPRCTHQESYHIWEDSIAIYFTKKKGKKEVNVGQMNSGLRSAWTGKARPRYVQGRRFTV